MAAPHDLKIGQCYCVSGHQRYGARYRWDGSWQRHFEPLSEPLPESLPSSAHSPPGSPSDSPSLDPPVDSTFGLPGDETLSESTTPPSNSSSDSSSLTVDFSHLFPNDFELGNDDEASFHDNSEDDQDESDDEDGIPRIAKWRLNLTALSKRYNIYAVAFRGEIHISRIRSCVDHAVPTEPDLVLKPPTSQLAQTVGGYIDRNMPHQINHLIMGELGMEEILLLAYDDGDVIGYYNSQIEKALLHTESGNTFEHSTPMTPFFHENTGKSTWGLAIHKQSRLIAASNNLSEIHVFAFALSPGVLPDENLTSNNQGLFYEYHKTRHAQDSSLDAFDADIKVRRSVNYRFVFTVSDHNIPNLAFSNDTDGSADKILAITIHARLVVLDIWSSHRQYIHGLHESYGKSRNAVWVRQNGWGILVLPQSSFLPTTTFKESLGLEPGEANYVFDNTYGHYISTENAFKHIKDNSIFHPCLAIATRNELALLDLRRRRPPTAVWHDVTKVDGWNAEVDEDTDRSVGYSPSSRHQRPHPTYTGSTGSNAVVLRDGSSVMRTYCSDIELVGSDADIGIMFSNPIGQTKPVGMGVPATYLPSERLAHLIHVPELFLVVAGSMCGRVALITLTRPRNPHYSFKRGFKVEAILPRGTDERRRLRSIYALLGVAVGPIPTRSPGEPRYRIILQYYDHRILTYEIYRSHTTEAIFVV